MNQNTKNIIDFNNFHKKWRGKLTDFDGAYGAQCVDLIRTYMKDNNYPKTSVRGNAFDWWTKGMGDNYIKVLNSLTAIPPVGAIMIWKQAMPYGHIGIAGRCNMLYAEILEQNGGSGNGDGKGNNAIRKRKDFYKNCVGWYVPKF